MKDINSSRRAPFGSNPEVGEAGQATQLRILAAANEAFAENGYARTSVEAITDLAGCSRPTFYQYFSGKEDLHRRLAARFGAELADLLDRMGPITGDQEGRDELCQWLDGLTAVLARYQAVANNFAAAVRTDDQMVTGSTRLSAAYRNRLLELIIDAPETDVSLDVLAAAINAVAYGASLYRSRVGDVSEARLSAALADTVHRALFGAIDNVNVGQQVEGTTAKHTSKHQPAEPDDPDGRHGRGLATRARLMDAATTAFGTLGFDGVRVDDIASEAGVSHGTFYRYFTDKNAVFSAHADAATEETVELLSQWPLTEGAETQWAKEYFDLFGRLGGVIACLPEARATGLSCADRSRRETALALQRGLEARGFGDTDADIVIGFALLENLPATAFRSLGITVDDAIGATAVILRQGVFGGTAGDAASSRSGSA